MEAVLKEKKVHWRKGKTSLPPYFECESFDEFSTDPDRIQLDWSKEAMEKARKDMGLFEKYNLSKKMELESEGNKSEWRKKRVELENYLAAVHYPLILHVAKRFVASVPGGRVVYDDIIGCMVS